MKRVIKKLAVIGQGLIGSSITRAVYKNGAAEEIAVTDISGDVRQRVKELGIGQSRVCATAAKTARDADLVIACVPVGQLGEVAAEIAPSLKPGAILSDVGSVKSVAIRDMQPQLPEGVHLVPAHPLAGSEFYGPDSGMPRLFEDKWCILTPAEGCDPHAVEITRKFWQALGSHVEIMSADRHDHVLSLTSHLPQLIAYSIFHTALRYEEEMQAEVIKYSAGGFRDFTRIASSNPSMWRDIFLMNKEPCLASLRQFMADLEACAEAIEKEDGERLLELFSTSRTTRRKVIEKEHVSVQASRKNKGRKAPPLLRPYASDDD
ncbi:MAG: prephenate dehydrogenase/arogenate dehydrogenase family protein [Rhizobiaceae bacterium]